MRAAFGLVGLLVGFGVLVYVWSSYNIPVAHSGRQAQDQARQVAGYDPAGGRVKDTIAMQPQSTNGKLDGLVVTSLTPGSMMEQHYGLKVNDLIVQVGPLPIGDDAELGIARVQEAYQRQDSIIIMRNGKKMNMPEDSRPQVGIPPTGTAPPGAPPQADERSSLQKQLDSIKVPTH